MGSLNAAKSLRARSNLLILLHLNHLRAKDTPSTRFNQQHLRGHD